MELEVLKSDDYYWLKERQPNKDYVWLVSVSGYVGNDSAWYGNAVRPVIYISQEELEKQESKKIEKLEKELEHVNDFSDTVNILIKKSR